MFDSASRATIDSKDTLEIADGIFVVGDEDCLLNSNNGVAKYFCMVGSQVNDADSSGIVEIRHYDNDANVIDEVETMVNKILDLSYILADGSIVFKHEDDAFNFLSVDMDAVDNETGG